MHHERTKHIDVKYHFIRDGISQGDILMKKIGTVDNPANMGMKHLLLTKFKECVNVVDLCNT